MANNKARISAFNLINDQNFLTILRWLEEPLCIRFLKDISQTELEKAISIMTICNKRGAKQLAPLLLITTSLLSEIYAQCKDIYNIGESIWSANCYIYSFHKQYRFDNDENECPICTLLKNILSYQLWNHFAVIKPIYIMVLSLIFYLNNLICYTLIQFKEDGLMYWYKMQVLESYISNTFTDNFKAFGSLPVNLQFYKMQSICKGFYKGIGFKLILLLQKKDLLRKEEF